MSFFTKGRGIIWTLSFATEEILEWQKQKSFLGKQPILYRRPGKDTGGIFGIYNSYHHLKACMCKNCLSYSGGAGIFCARGKSPVQGKKEDCVCQLLVTKLAGM